MKKYLLLTMLILLLIVAPNRVKAAVCDYRTLADYKDIASNIQLYADYEMVNGKPVFEITLTNIYDELYIVDATNSSKTKRYDYNSFVNENQLKLKGYSENQKLVFKIYSGSEDCYGQLLGTRYFTTPNYNEFSTDSVCKGAEEYSLCQRWGAISGDYDTFVKNVNTYKEKKKAKLEEPPASEKPSLRDRIFEFVGKYYVFLVSGIIFIILFLAVLKNLSVKKNEFNFKV